MLMSIIENILSLKNSELIKLKFEAEFSQMLNLTNLPLEHALLLQTI